MKFQEAVTEISWPQPQEMAGDKVHGVRPTSTKRSGRGGQIRTDDIRVPNAALYQAELRPGARADPCGFSEPNQEIPSLKFTFFYPGI